MQEKRRVTDITKLCDFLLAQAQTASPRHARRIAAELRVVRDLAKSRLARIHKQLSHRAADASQPGSAAL